MPPARFAIMIGAILFAAATTVAIAGIVTSKWGIPWATMAIVPLILAAILHLILKHRHG